MIGDKKIDMLNDVIVQYNKNLEKLFRDEVITSDECRKLYLEIEVFPHMTTIYHPNNMVCVINRQESEEGS